jgi:hypothetical protein
VGVDVAWVNAQHEQKQFMADTGQCITRLSISRWPKLPSSVCSRFIQAFSDALFNQAQIPDLLKGGTGEVVVVALLPSHEGRGIGRNVLARVVSDLATAGFERLHLTCSSDSKHRSHGFYRHLGWVATGRVDGHGDEILELDVAGPRPMSDTSVECPRGG